ncbi:hypothetical protein C8F04DRAFT_1387739 [Mycena alexandri]|uniref:Uncharacterized protein n=1 Tax=Mycena alexandri TaxID=1745969 RepID=A0AAD6XI91_9AGAR|nr:hypothetical protein C8F04DRAFT_1387739 [Mycena alexandri]
MAWLDENNKAQLEWIEALPTGVKVRQRFEDQYRELTRDCLNAMYAWVEKPLQAARDGSGEPAMPVFPYSAEDLDDMSPNSVAQSITTFLMKSYEAVFGTDNIPWAAIASTPDQYYDTNKFDLLFDSDGLGKLKGAKWFTLGSALAMGAGEGTPGFFRKVPAVVGEEEEEGATAEAARVKEAEAEVARVKEAEAEAARVKQQQQMEEAARVKEAETEAAQVKEAEAEAAWVKEAEAEVARVKEAEAEAARVKKQQVEEAAARAKEAEVEAARAKGRKGRKRKAEDELVPEPEEERRWPVRNRQTPQEAERERNQKAAEEAARGKVKPSFEYVDTNPAKKPGVGKLGSLGRELEFLRN